MIPPDQLDHRSALKGLSRGAGTSFKTLLASLLSSESFLFRTIPVLAKNSP
jgi:hypothetical protein